MTSRKSIGEISPIFLCLHCFCNSFDRKSGYCGNLTLIFFFSIWEQGLVNDRKFSGEGTSMILSNALNFV